MGWGVALSLALHGAWFGSLRVPPPAAPRTNQPRPAYQVPFEPNLGVSALAALASPIPVEPGGPERPGALDLDATEGAGGSGATLEHATRLLSFVSPLSLQDTDLNNLIESQTQRIRTATTRATQEMRRATPNAAAAVFLASGAGTRQERRPVAERDPQQGAQAEALRSARPQPGAQASGAQPGRAHAARSQPTGAALLSPQRGILESRGGRPSLAARVATARPNVDRGPAATQAETIDPKLRDNHDAELLAAALQRSIVDASTQRARRQAPGEGGAEHGPGLGLTQSGRGARAEAYAPGTGGAFALDTSDARYVRWFVEQKERVQQELSFPKPRALAKDQGISVYRVVIRRDGRLAQSPHLVRSSGFADFDEAAVVAIRRALPFSPLPERLLPEALDLTLLIPISFSNPMVQ
jgi:TonB family protein